MTPSSSPTVRPATREDLGAILGLIRELAEYEREPEAAVAQVSDLAAALFPETGSPTAWCHVGVVEGEGGGEQVVGMALWFLTFSTWTGRNGIWLEDLYVQPAHRGSGLGLALLRTLAGICVERGYPRLEWTVLTWNEPAIGFYRSLGAGPMADWQTYRLTGADLAGLGAG